MVKGHQVCIPCRLTPSWQHNFFAPDLALHSFVKLLLLAPPCSVLHSSVWSGLASAHLVLIGNSNIHMQAATILDNSLTHNWRSWRPWETGTEIESVPLSLPKLHDCWVGCYKQRRNSKRKETTTISEKLPAVQLTRERSEHGDKKELQACFIPFRRHQKAREEAHKWSSTKKERVSQNRTIQFQKAFAAM